MAAPLGPFVGRLSGSLARHDGGMVAALLRVSGFVPEAGSLLAQPAQHGDQWNRAKVWTQASASGTAEELEDYCEEKLPSPWAELLVAHLQALVAIQKREYVEAYSAHAQVLTVLIRAIVEEDKWVLPVLHSVIFDLRLLASLGDRTLKAQGSKPGLLQDAAQMLNKAFQSCITDRQTLSVSKKLGALDVVNNLFKVYFRLHQLRLCNNLVRSVTIASFPSMDQFPASHTVTFRFYTGMLAFYDENYRKAAEDMRAVLCRCHKDAKSNKRLVLSYLIPMQVLEGKMVHVDRLKRYGLSYYGPILQAVRTGNVGRFNQTLALMENVLQRRGLYLVFEKLRIIVYRNLFKRVFLLTKTVKMPLAAHLACLHRAGEEDATLDSLECVLSILIDQGYIKGYIAHERSFLVVSQTSAFPPISSVR